MAVRLSICLIVRDEEADLGRCLASVAGLGEIVVVDTGSTDRTVAIARAAGARVSHIPWPDDFAAARNVSLEAATGDWRFVLDADEELESREALLATLDGASALEGVSLLQRNLAPPGELIAYEDQPTVRLFRRGHRYQGRIHEQISPSIRRAGGRIGTSATVIVHRGYARGTAQRARRNLALLEAAVRDAPGDAYLLYQLGVTQKAAGDPAARANLERAVTIDGGMLGPDALATARMKLAQLALAEGDDARALAEARLCLVAQPHNVTALQIAIVACVTEKRFAEAASSCRKILACENLAAGPRRDLVSLLGALGG